MFALSVVVFIAIVVIVVWIEYHRRRAMHLRPMYMIGTTKGPKDYDYKGVDQG